jgi:hypothetical protein
MTAGASSSSSEAHFLSLLNNLAPRQPLAALPASF